MDISSSRSNETGVLKHVDPYRCLFYLWMVLDPTPKTPKNQARGLSLAGQLSRVTQRDPTLGDSGLLGSCDPLGHLPTHLAGGSGGSNL